MDVFVKKIYSHQTGEVQFLRFVQLGNRLMIQSLVHIIWNFPCEVQGAKVVSMGVPVKGDSNQQLEVVDPLSSFIAIFGRKVIQEHWLVVWTLLKGLCQLSVNTAGWNRTSLQGFQNDVLIW